MTRLEKILDDSDSILTRRACESDSTKITRADGHITAFSQAVVLGSSQKDTRTWNSPQAKFS